MSEKKAKEARRNVDPAEVIRKKWRLKKQKEAEAQSLIHQILGIAEVSNITPEGVNKIIGENVFYTAKGGETDGKEKENNQNGRAGDRRKKS